MLENLFYDTTTHKSYFSAWDMKEIPIAVNRENISELNLCF